MSGFRTQRATMSVKEKIEKVDEFSGYLISPLKKKYDTFFKSTMCTLKALRCWLKLKTTDSMPKGWLNKRQKIYDRLEKLDNDIGKEDTEEKVMEESEKDNIEVRRIQRRVNLADKIKSSYEAITFNILRREKNKELQEWKSYPGIEKIVHLSRNIVEKNETSKIMELIKIMR